MWSASIKDKTFNGGVLRVTVTFSNGTESFDKVMDITGGTLDTLERSVRGHLAALNVSESSQTGIAVGPINLPAEEAPSQLQADILKLRKLQRAIDLSIIAASNATYQATLAAVRNAPIADVLKLL